MSVRGTVTRNTLFNTFGRTWDAIISLFLVAYIVAKIGTEQYGLWAVVGAFTGFAALVDFGISSSYAKYIAEHRAKDEHASISSVVTTGFSFYAVFGAVFIAIAWPCLDSIMGMLGTTERFGDFASMQVRDDLHFLIKWGLVIFVVSNCLGPFTAIQTGFQRMDVTNAISAVAALVKLGATVYFLERGDGVRGLLYTNGAVIAFFSVCTIAAAFRLHPSLRIGPRHLRLDTFRRLFSFGWRTQVSRLANLIMFETDVLVIAILLRNLELAGLYRIGVELANKLRQTPTVMLSALMPAASDLHARDETERLGRIYLATTKYVAAATVPAAFLLAGCAGLIIPAWQGTAQDLAVSENVLRIMAIGYLANMLPGTAVAIALGMGRPDLQMRSGLISMIANVTLTVALALTIGFWGIPLATAISMAISWAWFAGAMGKAINVRALDMFRTCVAWPAAASLAVLLLSGAAEYFTPELSGRAANFGVFFAVALAAAALYLILLRKTPHFDESDLRFFDDTLRLDRLPGYRAWSRSMRRG